MDVARRGRVTVIVLATLAFGLVLGWGATTQGAVKKTPSASKALGALVGQANALPASAIGGTARLRLLALARRAKGTASTNPCGSVRTLAGFRKALKLVKLKSSVPKRLRAGLLRRLATLGSSSMTASRALLRSKRTKRCGGGVLPSDLGAARVQLLRSNENGLKVRVKLPQLQFVPQVGGGKLYTKLIAPNTDSPGAPGSPGIPFATESFGVPDGAAIKVTTSNVQSQTIDGVDVFPIQPEAQDAVEPPPNFLGGVFQSPKFMIDGKAYKKKGLVPGKPGGAALLGQIRDLNIGSLRIPSAQYDAPAGKLKVITSVDVQVDFEGSKGFSDQLDSPWERAQNRLAQALINVSVVKRPKLGIIIRPCGEEILVITNPSTRTAADTFATAKRAQGYRTSVVETGSGPGQIGTTNTQIQTYIRGRVNALLCIRPSYVVIIGDDELVPTFTATPGGIPSDLQYSMKNDIDELPDVAVGRILGNDLTQVTNAINKIVTYETTPPTGAMLTKAVVAAQFQDTDAEGEVNDGQEDRTFIQFAETVRNGLTARGVTVDRIYRDNPSTNPLKFNDGTDLPASLKKPAFAWDGDGADVTTAWNEGRFLIIHRDHGWSDGWGDPFFTTDNVDALTNGSLLPVVMSINCASAQYDTDETSFVQNALVKADGGAVGVFGDTRNSPSWHNSQIGLGFVDALLPSVLPSEGPAAKQRVGDALVHGKLRLAGLAPPSGPGIVGGDGSTRNELYLWHYFGDPTMQMWGGGSPPIIFDPGIFKALLVKFNPPKPGDPPPFLVEITLPPGLAGQPFSLLRNGEVIGKGTAGGDKVQIPALFNDGDPAADELTVALDADGAAPVEFPLAGGSALRQTCPQSVKFNTQGPTNITVTGKLIGAPAGSVVTASFQAPPTPNGTPLPQTVSVTTDAKGDWMATLTTTNRQYLGTTTVRSSYSGAPGITGSQSTPCGILIGL